MAGFVRGAGLAGATASVGIALVVLAGILSGAHPLLFLAGAGGAFVFHLLSPSSKLAQASGAVLAGVAISLLGLVTSTRWLSIAGALGAVVAIVFLSFIEERLPVLVLPVWVWAVAAAILVLVLLLPLVLGGGPLDHDESAYALKAKSWLFATPRSGWAVHRGPAMSAYAYPILALNGQEPALRALGIVSLAGLAAATWWLGFRMGGRWVASLSTVAILASPPILRRSTEFLSDVPSAALLVACMALVWREFAERQVPTYRLLWLLPFAWLAFYLRYQSLLSFGLLALTIVVLWWRKVRERPGPLVTGALLGLMGLVPHFMFSIGAMGSPFGILTWTTQAGGRDFTGDGLIDYTGMFGWTLGLFLGPLLIGLLLWWVVGSWKQTNERIRALFLLLPAGLQVLALGILGEAHERFVFFPYALVAVGGMLGFASVSGTWRPPIRRAFVVAISVLLIGTLAASVADSRRYVDSRRLRNEPLQLAALEVQQLAGGRDCGVLSSYVPQMTFYSECPTVRFLVSGTSEQAVSRIPGETTYMVLIEDGKRQPTGDDLDGLVSLSVGEPIVVTGERDSADLYVFEP